MACGNQCAKENIKRHKTKLNSILRVCAETGSWTTFNNGSCSMLPNSVVKRRRSTATTVPVSILATGTCTNARQVFQTSTSPPTSSNCNNRTTHATRVRMLGLQGPWAITWGRVRTMVSVFRVFFEGACKSLWRLSEK